MIDQTILQQLTKTLLEEKGVLEKELKTIAQKDMAMKDDWDAKFPQLSGDSGAHSNLEESADEVEDYEIALELEHSLERKLRDVNLALAKIDNGKYGVCEACGGEISIERLKANPEARFDKEHEKD